MVSAARVPLSQLTDELQSATGRFGGLSGPYGTPKDEKFMAVAERAVRNLIQAQSPEGGWRYSPNTDSDASVTGWVVMALQGAKMAKLEVPEETFKRVERFLDSQLSEKS